MSSNLAFLTPTLTYDPNNVFLNLARNASTFTSVAGTPNQTGVATTLTGLVNTPNTGIQNLINNILVLTTTGAQQAFDSLSGVQHTNGQQLMLGVSRQFRHLLFNRLRFNPISSLAFNPMQGPLIAYHGSDWPLLAASASLGVQETLTEERGFWLQGFGSVGEIEDDANATGADYDTKGVAIGADTNWRNGVVGLAGSYTRSDADTFGGDTDIDSFQAALYGDWNHEDYYVNAYVGGGFHEADSSRAVIVGATTSTASAEYDTYNVSASVEAGRAIPLKPTTTLTPYIGIDYSHIDREDFTETGAGAANLSVKDSDEDSLRTRVGLRLHHAITKADGSQVTPYAYAGYVREHLDNESTMTAGFSTVPTATFNISGVELDRNRAEFGAGITGQLKENVTFNVGYDGNYAGSDDNHAFSATIKITW